MGATNRRRARDNQHTPRAAKARYGRGQWTQATRTALFVLASAADAGFRFRAVGYGKLEIEGPAGVDPALCEPTIAVIRQHGPEIQRLVRWLNAEAAEGRYWKPKAAGGAS
jgi:hypothetical protein